jgi:hypothetical protein
MSMPEMRLVEFPLDALGTGVEARTGKVFDARQNTDKGYDYTRDAAAGFTATLEGSVSGDNWTLIVALAASSQGAVGAQYNYLRVNCTVGGAVGATTRLVAAGKVL